MPRMYDQRIVDASGAFLLGELERLDKKLHMPLSSVSWNRDIDLREDVTIADETSSFTTTLFAAAGGISPTGKNWIAQSSTAIPGIAVDTNKVPSPLHLWGITLGWTVIELAAAQQVGRPIDAQKYQGMRTKYNMDVDEMVYIGDADKGATGLCNNPNVFAQNSTLDWSTATPRQILSDINDFLAQVWANSAHAVVPEQLLLPSSEFVRLLDPITEAADKSVLTYIAENSLTFAQTGRKLEIHPLKWLNGIAPGGANRRIAYSRKEEYVRYPLVPVQNTPLQLQGLHQLTVYYSKLGHVEFVYPETIGYQDGQ